MKNCLFARVRFHDKGTFLVAKGVSPHPDNASRALYSTVKCVIRPLTEFSHMIYSS